jgi:hypothetical protein
MKKVPTILAIAFLLSTLFLIYFFVFRGTVVESDDHRVAIELSEPNAEFALKEMRDFLESIQQINEGIINKDSNQVYDGARKSGNEVVEQTPQGMMASLPIGFKKLGLSVHNGFDKIADSIRANNDFGYAQKEMNTLLNSCIACHRSYKIVVRN